MQMRGVTVTWLGNDVMELPLRSSVVVLAKMLFLSIGNHSNVCAWLQMGATNHCVPIPVHKYLSETAKGNFCIDSTEFSLDDKMWVTVFSPISQVLRARLFQISAIWNSSSLVCLIRNLITVLVGATE